MRRRRQDERPYAVEIEDIGRIPLVSFRIGGDQPVSTGGAKAADPKVIDFDSELGEHSSVLLQGMARGTHCEGAVVEGPGVRWTFKDVVVAAHRTAGTHGEDPPTEHWTLEAAEVAFG